MASLLYRLGLFAARRAKTIIVTWLTLLVVAVASFAALGGQLSDQISVPDMPTTQVADRLADELPEASGGSAPVVYRTADGSEFTETQRERIVGLARDVGELAPVDTVNDPFAAQAELDEGRQELTARRAQLEGGREQLANARDQIESAYADLDEGEVELDAAREQAEASGDLPAVEPELQAEQQRIDANREELAAEEAALEEEAQQITAGEAELERGETLMTLSERARTVSEEENVAVMAITFHEPLENVATDELSNVTDVLTAAEIDGVEVLPSSELSMELPHLFSTAEAIGLIIAAVILLAMLGTLIGAGLPLLNALVGVGIGVAGALALSGVVEMMSVTPILGLMLGLAVGIDYSLFIIHRHRNQLRMGMNVRESIALANGTSGNAVLFAGATVVIALAALNLTGLGFLGLMGTIGAACVAIAVLIALTMTPALLRLIGPRVLRGKERRQSQQAPDDAASTTTPGTKTPTTPMRTAKAIGIAVLAAAALAALAVPTGSLRLGLPDGGSEAEDSNAYQAYATVEDAFGQGMNGPLVVVADLPGGLDEAAATEQQVEIATTLAARDDVATAVPVGMNDDHTVAALQLIPEEGPASAAVEQLVHDLRDGAGMGDAISDVELSVAGMPAANIDISTIIADALPLYLIVVIGLSLVLMVMVFRSLLLPVVATLGFVLSFAAATGGVVAVFQWGWLGDLFGVAEPGPVISFLPIIMVGILFGLAMDYQLFTASGMREAYAHGAAPRLAVRQGLHAGRAVVTAAALIMSSVFGGFVFTPDPIVASVGLGLALGVLLDAFVVRLLLVPALLHLAGPAAWWLPRWLDRLLPNVDVEGTALERTADSESEQHAGEPVPSAHR